VKSPVNAAGRRAGGIFSAIHGPVLPFGTALFTSIFAANRVLASAGQQLQWQQTAPRVIHRAGVG